MRSRKFFALLGMMCVLALSVVPASAQNNGDGGSGSRKGSSESAATAQALPATSLSLLLPAVDVGGSEVIVAVIRNQGTETASYEISTQIFGQSNGGPIKTQTNSGTLAPGASFTQTFTFSSSTEGVFDVASSFSLNGSSVGTSNTSFEVF